MKELDFNSIKSNREFLENYELSDRAAQMGDEMLRKNGLTPVPFGEDRRNERVWEVGEDKPDRKILKVGREIALVDWKGKSKDYWMINERACNGYLSLVSCHRLMRGRDGRASELVRESKEPMSVEEDDQSQDGLQEKA